MRDFEDTQKARARASHGAVVNVPNGSRLTRFAGFEDCQITREGYCKRERVLQAVGLCTQHHLNLLISRYSKVATTIKASPKTFFQVSKIWRFDLNKYVVP